MTGTITVEREPLIYDVLANPQNSWVKDHWDTRSGTRTGPAKARLARHAKEMAVELRERGEHPLRERRATSDFLAPPTSFERRVGNQTGQPSQFTPPLWIVDRASTAARPERVLADLIPSFPLPDGVASVNVPRIVSGTATAPVVLNQASPAHDFTDGKTVSQVTTIVGTSDVSLQLLEQSGTAGASLDAVVFRDLLADYDQRLEEQLTVGVGTSRNQLLGALPIAEAEGIKAEYTSATPTATGLYPHLGEVFGAVSTTRKLRPQCWVLRGGRWAFLVTGEDEQKRPLGVPDAHLPAPITPDGHPDPIGVLTGLPTYTSEAISTTLGSTATQDVILAIRPTDMLLWESEPTLNVFKEVLSGSLEARIQIHRRAAAILGRYPSGIGYLTGTGMVPTTNE
jgi:hypothetical protein